MNIQAVWTEEIPQQIITKDYDELEAFMSLLDFMEDNDLKVYLNEDEIYGLEKFCDWIYSKKDAELSDIKRELMLRMEKCAYCDSKQAQEFMNEVGKVQKEKYFAMDFREEKPFYAVTVDKLYQICRKYLAVESKAEFKSDMEFCFPDIYFDTSVPGSLNTLNRNFEDIRAEIVAHLTAINNYKDAFLEFMEQNRGYREIAAKFMEKNEIECSPQGDRKQTVNLKREFKNDITGANEEVVCELHTKFKKYNIDRTKQDRIYFAPARKGVCSDRTIVVHIGKHL